MNSHAIECASPVQDVDAAGWTGLAEGVQNHFRPVTIAIPTGSY